MDDEKTCPREHCAWANSIYQKCTWPGKACPYQHERDKAAAAEDAKKEAVEASRKARKHQQRLAMEAYKSGRITGVYPKNGKWQVHMHYNGERRYVGTFDTLQMALEVRTQAQQHKDSGDFEEWRDSVVRRQKGRIS